MFITIVFNSKPDILQGNPDGLQTLSFPPWLTLCRAQINTFYWCFTDAQTLREQKKGTCVCSPVSLQLVAACEPLPTEHPAANKRSLPRMPAQVCSQVWSFSIYFPAACNVADVLLLLPCAGSSEKNRYGELGSWYVYFLCKALQSVKIQEKQHQFDLLTSHLTLYSWGKYMPLCAVSCPPDPTDPHHPPAWREGGTDRSCSGWSRCSAASLQSLALPLSECLEWMCTLISTEARLPKNTVRAALLLRVSGSMAANFTSETPY